MNWPLLAYLAVFIALTVSPLTAVCVLLVLANRRSAELLAKRPLARNLMEFSDAMEGKGQFAESRKDSPARVTRELSPRHVPLSSDNGDGLPVDGARFMQEM